MTTVAYQGEPGAFSEQASINFFGPDCETAGLTSFDAVFDAVSGARAEFGVVPVENSLAGSIHRNYDLLMRHDLHVVGEFVLRISLQLLALPGVALSDITRIYSHWQPLGQCERTLASLLPGAERIEVYDTAGSAKMLASEGRRDTAAIASSRAGEIYKLSMLRDAIEDDRTNFTRFVVLSRTPHSGPQEHMPDGRPNPGYKTSIVFSTPNVPGSLFKAMAAFALRDVDLTKMESRPLQGAPWEYLFYLDFIGSESDPVCARALANLREHITSLRVLGSFPRTGVSRQAGS